MKRTVRSRQLGQTILEVIIATSVVGLVMTAVVAVVSVSLRNAARAKAKSVGTKYTQEGIEYFRAQRNLMGWESFFEEIQQSGVFSTFCLASLPYTTNGGLESVPERPCTTSEFVDEDNIYQREAEVTITNVGGQNIVTVTINTTWIDSGRTATSNATVEMQQSQN
jgi:type II secretory pathway pseudopilin PulG